MKTAIICIAKDEDLYIDEWLSYYYKLGFTDIYLIQNEWHYTGKFLNSEHLFLRDRIGKMSDKTWSDNQLKWYNEVLPEIESQYDFIGIFDIDEFLVIKNNKSLNEFLLSYRNDPAIFINWRIFGDSNIKSFSLDNTSVLKRFLYCGKQLHQNGKTIINTGLRQHNRMCSVHMLLYNNKAYCKSCNDAEVFHYRNKTYQERKSKPHKMSQTDFDKFYKIYNQNDVINTQACDFMYGIIPETSNIDKIAFEKYSDFISSLKTNKCNIVQYCIEDSFISERKINQPPNFIKFLQKNNIKYISNVVRYPFGAMNNHHWQTTWVWKNFIPQLFADLKIEFNVAKYRFINKKYKQFDFSYHEPTDNSAYTYTDLENGITKQIITSNDVLDMSFNNPYHQRFLGFHRPCIIEKQCKNTNRTCIINCDSMAIPIIPLLIPEFDVILVLDNRTFVSYSELIHNFNPTHYISLGLVRNYMNIDKCIIDKIDTKLYSIIHNKIFERNIQ